MEILAKCKCPKCEKWAYPRPTNVISYIESEGWSGKVDLMCAYCNTIIGTFRFEYAVDEFMDRVIKD